MVTIEIEKKVQEDFIKLSIEAGFFDNEDEIKPLIKAKIIPYMTMRNFVICRIYDKYLIANKGKVTHTLDDLWDDYGLFPTHIRKVYEANKRFFT